MAWRCPAGIEFLPQRRAHLAPVNEIRSRTFSFCWRFSECIGQRRLAVAATADFTKGSNSNSGPLGVNDVGGHLSLVVAISSVQSHNHTHLHTTLQLLGRVLKAYLEKAGGTCVPSFSGAPWQDRTTFRARLVLPAPLTRCHMLAVVFAGLLLPPTNGARRGATVGE